MSAQRSNIVLIGMPGAGKSTVGVILAKQISRAFVDTDILIQTRTGRMLQDIVDDEGYMALRKVEEEVLLEMTLEHHVIATGGSAAYSEPAMHHLRANGVLVFLDVDLATLEARVSNFSTRGLARRPEQSFSDLFRERHALYAKYADITVPGEGLTQERVCERIIRETRGRLINR